MAKLKTNKAKLSMKDGIDSILKSHGIDLDNSIKEPLLNDLVEYFNSVYKPNKTTPKYWSALVANYLSFYKLITNEKASFPPAHASALSKLDKVLMNRYLGTHTDAVWDEYTSLRQHLIFYNEAIKLDFYKRSFCISMLYNNFDSIRAQLADLKNKQKELDKKILG